MLNKELREIISRAEIISFDIFDTLLVRPYADPAGVFVHLETITSCQGFYELRKSAEDSARKFFNVCQVTYDEIYEILPEEFKFIKNLELNLEINGLYQNPEMKIVYDYVIEQGKRVIFTTDMYLSEDILIKILAKNGYDTFERIYVSASQRKSKYEFTLFPYIINDMQIEAKKILHIGDNFNSDYRAATLAGLVGYKIASPRERFFEKFSHLETFYNKNKASLTANIIIGLLIKHYIKKGPFKNYWEEFGYLWGGPVCYGLSKFLHSEMKKANIDEIICIARDGYTIEKILNHIDPTIITHYIYAPRIIHLLTSLECDNELPWTQRSKSIINAYKKILPQLATEYPKKGFDTDNENLKFIKDHLNILQPAADRIYNSYLTYIKQFSIKSDTIALFDISAGGFSSLKLMQRVFPSKNILGLYWLIAVKDVLGINCIAFQKNFLNYFHNYEIIEFIVTAPELPISNVTDNGNFLRVNNKYEQLRVDAYTHISEGEIKFAQDIINTFGCDIEFDVDILINYINIFCDHISIEDLYYFDDIYHGISEDHEKYIKVIQTKKKRKKFTSLKYHIYRFLALVTFGNLHKHFDIKRKKYKKASAEKKCKERKLLG